MLEISHEIVQQIADMDTKHSWAAKLMRLPVEDADQAENLICSWIRQQVTDMFPRSDEAERIVRHTWLHMLECEAIDKWINENPLKGEYIPVIYGASQAAYYGAQDVMYVEQRDINYATKFLQFMKDGLMMPDVNKILNIINDPDCEDRDISSDISNEWKQKQLKHLREIDAIDEQKEKEIQQLREKEEKVRQEALDRELQETLEEMKKLFKPKEGNK